MPFKPGNKEGCKSQKPKPFRDALMMELAGNEIEIPVPKRSLRALARALIVKGCAGDHASIKEIADRVDGRVAHIVGGDEDTGPISLIMSWRNSSSLKSTTIPDPISETSTTAHNDGPPLLLAEEQEKPLPVSMTFKEQP